MLRQGSQGTRLNYLHVETQTKQGWIPFAYWIYILKGDNAVPYSMTFLNAVFVYHTECVCAVCFMNVTDIRVYLVFKRSDSLLLKVVC